MDDFGPWLTDWDTSWDTSFQEAAQLLQTSNQLQGHVTSHTPPLNFRENGAVEAPHMQTHNEDATKDSGKDWTDGEPRLSFQSNHAKPPAIHELERSQLPNTRKLPPAKGGKCTWPGCKSKVFFRRNYELQRHQKKHIPKEYFPCTAVNCKYRGSKAFYRADKLKDHVYEGHDDDTLFACPIPGCLGDLNPLPRYLMAIHCRNHYYGVNGEYQKHLVALEDCDKTRKCCIDTCSQKHVIDLTQHVRWNHTSEEWIQNHSALAAEGIDAATGHLFCPIRGCTTLSASREELVYHVITAHLVISVAHFEAFRTQYIIIDSTSPGPFNFLSWETWEARLREGLVVVGTEASCNWCGCRAAKAVTNNSFTTKHQMDMLAPSSNFEADKQQILKMIPEFSSHPIFDAVLPEVNRTELRKG